MLFRLPNKHDHFILWHVEEKATAAHLISLGRQWPAMDALRMQTAKFGFKDMHIIVDGINQQEFLR
jgi:hypothetical protein